jgi:hypothetical protein
VDERYERQLDALFAQLGVEKAPAGLTARLRRIPLEEGERKPWWHSLWPVSMPAVAPRWVLAPVLAIALVAVGLMMALPQGPSQEEVLQARRELALAFHYIDKAGLITGDEIQSVLGRELRHTVKGNLSKHIPFTEQFTEQSLEEEKS